MPYELVSPYATCELEAVVVVQVIVALEEEVGFADTAEIAGGLTTLLTVTEMLPDVVFNPAASAATPAGGYGDTAEGR